MVSDRKTSVLNAIAIDEVVFNRLVGIEILRQEPRLINILETTIERLMPYKITLQELFQGITLAK